MPTAPHPHQFIDAAGETWTVVFHVGTARRVREELQVDLLAFDDETLFARLAVDPELLVDVLHCVLRDECERRQIDPAGFAERLIGDALDAAAEALLGAIVDFFPRQRRTLLAAALTKSRTLMMKQTEHALQVIEGPQLDEMLQRELEKQDAELAAWTSGKSSGNGPASSDSTPAPSASASLPP